MRVIRDLADAQIERPAYITVGVFDGVHRGHQQLVSSMVESAHCNAASAVAYTFVPHPSVVLGRPPIPLLTTVAERADLLEQLGLGYLVVPPFTAATAQMSAYDFTNMLIQKLGMVELWAGPDFGLGRGRQGTVPFLQQLGEEMGFTVHVVAKLVCGGGRVSSSRIRTALTEGDLLHATECLGRPYRLTGTVDYRQAQPRGRAGPGWHSVVIPNERLIPADGVYACEVHTSETQRTTGVTYITNRGAQTPGISSLRLALSPRATLSSEIHTVYIDLVTPMRSTDRRSSDGLRPDTVAQDIAEAIHRVSQLRASRQIGRATD
ncbi:MAG: hypothetical protein MUQ10_02760 [Anaerolineae bacterium]|nr:hypothetical protein [Anaerolineae bacterium]